MNEIHIACQRTREAESLAALALAENALSRWEGATRAMMNIARQRQKNRTTGPGGANQ